MTLLPVSTWAMKVWQDIGLLWAHYCLRTISDTIYLAIHVHIAYMVWGLWAFWCICNLIPKVLILVKTWLSREENHGPLTCVASPEVIILALMDCYCQVPTHHCHPADRWWAHSEDDSTRIDWIWLNWTLIHGIVNIGQKPELFCSMLFELKVNLKFRVAFWRLRVRVCNLA